MSISACLQRRAVGAHGVDDSLVEREAVLDDRRQVGRRDLGHLEPAALRLEGAVVGAGLDRRRSREDADAPAVGYRGGDLGLRLDHRDHLDAALRGDRRAVSAPPRSPSCRRRRATLRRARAGIGETSSTRCASSPALRAVGKLGAVAEVEEVLLGQRDEALVKDGEAADSGVEHRDRKLAAAACQARLRSRALRPSGTRRRSAGSR